MVALLGVVLGAVIAGGISILQARDARRHDAQLRWQERKLAAYLDYGRTGLLQPVARGNRSDRRSRRPRTSPARGRSAGPRVVALVPAGVAVSPAHEAARRAARGTNCRRTPLCSRASCPTPTSDGCPRTICPDYGSGGLRRSRSVRKYTDRLIRARVAAAMAPAHQYQPPSVTAATIKPAANTTSVMASPSRHHRGKRELTL
jgi:hypothetical protein